jgi:hypothetical protein
MKGNDTMSLTAKMLSIMMFAVTLSASAEYVWDADGGQTSFGDDVAFTFDEGGKISIMEIVSGDDSDIVISGDEMLFSDDAKIAIDMLKGGNVIFNNPVSTEGRLTVTNAGWSLYQYKGDYLPSVASGNRQTVVVGKSLDSIEFHSVVFNMSTIRGRSVPYFVERTEAGLEAQFQIPSVNFLKCVKVRLEQSGDDIVASVVYARYTKAADPGSVNFDGLKIVKSSPGDGEAIEYTIATKEDQLSAYGIGEMALCTKGLSAVHVRFTKEVVGELQIAENAVVTVSQEALPGWSSKVSGNGGTLIFEGAELPDGPVTYALGANSMPGKTFTLFAPNQDLKDMTILSAKLAGSGIIGSGKTVTAHLCFIENDGMKASVWCQYMSNADDDKNRGTVKAVKLAFKQVCTDVYIAVEIAKYLSQDAGKTYKYGVDLENHSDSIEQKYIATSLYGTGYGIGALEVSFKRAAPSVTVNLVDGCTLSNGVFRATGSVALSAAEKNALPPCGKVEVESGADLVLKYETDSGLKGIGDGNTQMDIRNGSRLRLASKYSIHPEQIINLCGGELQVGVGRYVNSSSFGDIYMQNCNLQGSVINGAYIRTGRYVDSVFTVDGTAPSSIDTGLQVLGASGTDTSITVGFDVSDVTGNDEIDLFMRGGLMDWRTGGSQGSVFVRKSGAGTMALLAENTFGKSTKGVFHISEGTLLLATNGATHATQYCRLDGGTLAAAAATTNELGALEKVTASSRIVLEDEAALSFTEVKSSGWAASQQIIVEGNLGRSASLRIGTSSSSLTPAQKSLIRCRVPGVDRLARVLFDENGYARSWMGGMTISIR